jgi:predicted glycogen debranching enzyme
MKSSPWPRVDVSGRLENAEREWLHTNGAGAYASSTVAMMHTRRYHGVLIAALEPPARRFAIVSHAETNVVTARRVYRLAAHQFPGVAPSPGFRHLEAFHQDPLPRWTYRLGKVRFERTLALVRGENAAILRYKWFGKHPARLSLSPLLSMRDHHTVVHEHGGMVQRVRIRPHEVESQPVPGVPPVLFRHTGVFVGSPDWYRRFEHVEDKARGLEGEEDLWTPGTFDLELPPTVPIYFTIALEKLPEGPPEEAFEQAREALLRSDPGSERSFAVRKLCIAAEAFKADAGPRAAILAGYPWLGPETKEALIALPGLYLVPGEHERAKVALGGILAAQQGGLLPRRLYGGRGTPTLSAEASLWLFETARLVVQKLGAPDPFVRGQLYPALVRTFEHVLLGPSDVLWLTRDGLVENGDREGALTWGDGRKQHSVSSSRRGLAVEFQALFSRGCRTLHGLARIYGDLDTAERTARAGQEIREAFRRRFWCRSTNYPYDCIRDHGREGAFADASIRPGALVALDADPELFTRRQAVSILTTVRDRLLTPRGIRSLDPDAPEYRGAYTGELVERRLAYHQGLAWAHLIGAFARAALRLEPDDFDLIEDLRAMIERDLESGTLLGQVTQFSDGEPPYHPGGCPAYAPSVAELLRTLVWDLRV